ncbi:putative ester cyclase [Variovorax sp. PBS-H4]|uniref:ester cyclase n=1 Tax=Variovorax sp. PBS-H4 TaxID=434008 RepID=UPI0013167F61|nr:ester cyclase [Variovorax sp. PBS-H4]VTU25434.1 putative ester cyclase [Variovorax sp. PBS-H4]
MSNISSSRKVLVLGAGELGMPVIRELLRFGHLGGSISVLLPPMMQGGANDVVSKQREELRLLGLDVVEADLAKDSVEELASIFSKFTQVVGCTGFVGGRGTQLKITAAALSADIEHYIPWQFGVDYDIIGHGSGQEVFDEQFDVRNLLRSQSRVKWTIVSTGMFTSFVFLPAFGLVNLERGIVHALGAWSHRLTVTTPEDIGRMTALIAVSNREHADKVVYLSGDTFTYEELAITVEQVLGRPMERVLWSIAELKAEVAKHPEDTMRKYRLGFARDDGVAWPKAETLNARRNIAMVDVATWLRRWRDFSGSLTPDWDTSTATDTLAYRMAKPELLVASADPDGSDIATLTQRYYGWWNGGSDAMLATTVSPDFRDRTPPPGREPSIAGLTAAQSAFHEAFPNGRVHVLQQVIVGDRVVSHLRVTGRFLGSREGRSGAGQRIDYLATDIMRIAGGQIVESWHVEDHLSLQQQLA